MSPDFPLSFQLLPLRRYKRVHLGKGRPPKDGLGPYHLRYQDPVTGRRAPWPCVGNDLAAAIEARNKKEAYLHPRANGVSVVEPSVSSRRLVSEAVLEYLSEVEAQKARSTRLLYGYALNRFQKSCKTRCLNEIVRRDLLEFITLARKDGLRDRSQVTKFSLAGG